MGLLADPDTRGLHTYAGSVSILNSLLERNVALISEGSLYFGGAGFYIFEAATAKDDSWIGSELDYVSFGYDCAAFIGQLTVEDECVGGLILPYGPWTLEHKGFAAALDEVDEGADADLRGLLALFPMEPRQVGVFTIVEGIVICPHEDLEVAMESDEAVTFEGAGEWMLLAHSEDDDWVDGPVLTVRSDLVS